jgi:hypothetical protein
VGVFKGAEEEEHHKKRNIEKCGEENYKGNKDNNERNKMEIKVDKEIKMSLFDTDLWSTKRNFPSIA